MPSWSLATDADNECFMARLDNQPGDSKESQTAIHGQRAKYLKRLRWIDHVHTMGYYHS